ncbi:MAG: TetR/AcrR family transcriptional regulator [Bacteroidales bacterium]|nr:TetR/AcrR family transcriptional regulator [Bacteroidales bacterium]
MIDRQKIITTAAELYLKYGIKSVTVDDLANELGISKKTIYQHISNKEELIDAVINELTSIIHNGLEKEMDSQDDIFDSLLKASVFLVTIMEKLSSSFVYSLKKYQHPLYCNLKDFTDKELYFRIEKLIKTGIQKGYFRNDLTFNSLFLIQMNKLSGMAYAPSEFQNLQYTKETFFMLLVNDIRGITTIEGHKILDDKVKEFMKMI